MVLAGGLQAEKREKERMKREREQAKLAKLAADDSDEDIVVISAAIAAYEAERLAIPRWW